MTTDEEKSHRLPIGQILIGLVVLGLIVSMGRQLTGVLPQFATWVDGLGNWGPVAFIVGYAGAAVVFIPGSVLTLAAGAIFGLVRGTIFVMLGATAGSALAFLIARYVARSAIENRLSENKRFAAIDKAIGREGFKIVLLLRLCPVFPFNLLNYSLGLTRVKFVDYIAASIGMLPGSLLYIYYGKLAGDVAQIATGGPVGRDGGYFVILLLGLIATILVTTLITRTARRALREATGT